MKNNFKRCLALLLALMTIVGAFSIPVSAAEECDHTWEKVGSKDPTCTAQGYETWFCTTCQEYEVRNITPKLNHNYVEATAKLEPTCSTNGYEKGAIVCSVCGDVKDVDEDGDKVDDGYLAADATISGDGKDLHKWGAGAVTGNPCLDATITTKYTCALCKKTYTTTTQSATDGKHKYEYTVVTAPTCKVEGLVIRTCTVKECGETTNLTIAKVASHSLPSKYSYEKDKDGHYAYKQCSICKDKIYFNANDAQVAKKADAKVAHEADTAAGKTTTVVSTCEKLGTKTTTCKVCGYKTTTNLPVSEQPDHTYNPNTPLKTVASSHTPAKVVHGYSEYLCTTCGQTFKIYENLDMREVPKNLDDHSWIDDPNVAAVEGTCYVGGVKTLKCSVSGCTAKKNVETEKKHAYGAEQTEPANCIEPGYKYQECAYCGDIKKTADIPTTNNNGKHGDLKEDKTNAEYKPATCLNKGRIPMVCEDCGEILDWKDEKWTGAAHTVAKTSEGDGCYYDKYDVYSCSVCNDTRYDLVLKAEGKHANGNEIVLRTATCYEEGIMGYKCSRCGLQTETRKLGFDADAHVGKQVYSINATAEWGVENKNTAAADGKWPAVDESKYSCVEVIYEWWYCNSCHRNYRAPLEKKVTLTATGLAGKILYNNEYKATVDFVGKSGAHTLYIDVERMPTCYQVGTGVQKCAMGCNYEPQNVNIAKVPHTIGLIDGTTVNKDAKYTTTDPATLINVTCAADVKWRQFCVECDEWVATGTEKAEEHTWPNNGAYSINTNNHKDDKAATCKAEGQESRKCSECGKVETRKIAINPNAHVKDTASGKTTVGKPATCTTNGVVETYTCMTCGKKYTEKTENNKTTQDVVDKAPVIPATGHQTFAAAIDNKADNGGLVLGTVVAPTCVTVGYTPVLCDQCDVADDPNTTEDETYFVEIGWITYVAEQDHNYKDQNSDNKIDDKDRLTQIATCYTYEYTYFECTRCSERLEKKENTSKPKAAHKNKAGDVLTGDCRLELDDYKCANVIEYEADGKTPKTYCPETILPEHDYVVEEFKECKVTKKTCKVCGDLVWDPEDNGNGNVKHTYVTVVEPTLKTEGVEACVVCGYENPVKIPTLDAVTFSMNAYNPNGGDIVNGGLVHVTINMKTVEAIEVNTIRVAVKFETDDLIFKGIVNSESVFGNLSSEPQANAQKGTVYVFDDAGRERYNIILDGEMEFVTLEFYVKPDAYLVKDREESILSFVDANDTELSPSVSYWDVAASTDKTVYSEYSFDVTTNNKIDLDIDQLGDVDNNGLVNNYDLVAVRDAMAEGAEYDAVLDIDHDGEITIKDYKFIKEYMVAKYEYWQFADLDSYNEYLGTKDSKANDKAAYMKWLDPSYTVKA